MQENTCRESIGQFPEEGDLKQARPGGAGRPRGVVGGGDSKERRLREEAEWACRDSTRKGPAEVNSIPWKGRRWGHEGR